MLLYGFDYATSKYNIKGSKTLFDILGGYFLKIESWKRITHVESRTPAITKAKRLA